MRREGWSSMSKMTIQLILLNVLLFAGTFVAVIYFVKRDSLKRSGKAEIEHRRKMNNRYVMLYNNFITRKRFRRIVERFSSLDALTLDGVKEQSVNLFTRSVSISLALPILSLILLKDVTLSCLTGLVGYIYYDMTVDGAIDKWYGKMLNQLSMTLASIREQYMMCHSVPTSLLTCETGKLCSNPIRHIYDIITSVNASEELDAYCSTAPIRLLKTLALTCYIVNENGDEVRDGEQFAFSEDLTIMRQECDAEINRITLTRSSFKSLPKVALIGLGITPFLDMFLLSTIPGTSTLIKGVYGSVEKTIIILISVLVYYYISVAQRPSVVNKIDVIGVVNTISKNRVVNKFVKNLIPKTYRGRRRLNLLIKSSISSKTLDYIYTAKCIYSVIAFVLTFICLCVYTSLAKTSLWNNHTSISFIPDSIEMTEVMYNNLVLLDEEYMTQEFKMSESDTVNLVRARLRGLNDLDIQNQADRLSAKWDKYYAIGFKWYYVIVSFIAGIAGWFSVELSLFFRKGLVAFEAEEDVMQLQTLAIVLSNTNMSVFDALYWFSRQSTVHKAVLEFAYYEYTSDPEGSLDKLEYSTKNNDLKRLINKLKASVYSLSLQEAFSDVKLDKVQSLAQRELKQKKVIESKTQNAKLLSMLPMYFALIFGFVGVILILGISDLTKMFGQLGG